MKSKGKITRRRLSVLTFLFWMSLSSVAGADLEEPDTVVSPLRLSPDMISGLGLEISTWGDESRIARWSQLFTGEELSVSVFDSTPMNAKDHPSPSKSRIREYPYDQFVLVLSGKSILTDEAGQSFTFVAGDFFVVPKGFSGTWEDFGVYRELIVIMEEAFRTRSLNIQKID